MNIYIISSVYNFKKLLEAESETREGAFSDCVFVSRDWFVLKEIESAGYTGVVLDNMLDKDEVERATRLRMDALETWFLDKERNDFSLYRGISLADCSQQHFYQNAFTQIFSFVPNILRLIEEYKPEKIIYEHHLFYRECIHFDKEDLLLGSICDKYGIGLEVLRTDRCDDLDSLKFSEANVLKRKKDFIIKPLRVASKKGWIFDCINFFQIGVKHRLRQLLRPGEKCIFTDSDRGTANFRKESEGRGSYSFIINRIYKDFRENIFNSTILIKSHKEPDQGSLNMIRERWQKAFGSRADDKYTYYGIDLSSYMKAEVEWVIGNVFPVLMECIDKVLWIFSKVRVDILLSQTDAPIAYKYIYSIAKKQGIENYSHPDGIRSTIEPGYRHSDKVLLYSTGTVDDFKAEGVKSELFVVGNPPFQEMFKRRAGMPGSLLKDRKARVLIGAKSEGPQVLGHHFSSSNQFLEEIMKGLDPFRDKLDITVRTVPGQSNYLHSLKKRHLKEYDYNIQSADEISFAGMVPDFDIFIMTWSTTALEAAILGKFVIFYCDDKVFQYPPLDGKSELATVSSPEELTAELENLLGGDIESCREFNKKEVLERYSGPLETPSSIELIRGVFEVSR